MHGSPDLVSTTNVNIKEQLSNGFFKYTCIVDLVFKSVDVALILSGIGLFVFLVWGGIEYMTSGGDKAKTETAQKRITGAVIGVAIVASSYAIWKIALYFFGIDAPNVCQDNPFQGRVSGSI